tara:strand:- start:1076 stop:1804 length:729 start_codon:yes stop_codon:yes gene_type:complete
MAANDEENGGFFGYKNIKDMFDGGGKNKTGATFEGGGPLSAMANAMNIAPSGYHASQAQINANAPAPVQAAQMQQQTYRKPTRNTPSYSFFQDIRDGGGMGYEGNNFRGANGYSVLANMLGLQPLGYADRMAEAQALAGGTQTSVAQPSQIASGTGVSAPQIAPSPQIAGGTDLQTASALDLMFTPQQPLSYGALSPTSTSYFQPPPAVSGPLSIDAMSTEDLLRMIKQGLGDPLGNGNFTS